MTGRRLHLSELPGWPLYLRRIEAAAYLGVSPEVFDAEVKAGMWHQPVRRGAKGALRTWDRECLDRERPRTPVIEKAAVPAASEVSWRELFSAAAAKRRRRRVPLGERLGLGCG